MDSDSLAASRIAGQMTTVSGIRFLFTAMGTLKSEFKPLFDGRWHAPRAAEGSHSYHRLAGGDGR